MKDSSTEAERLFQEGYQKLESEPKETLVSSKEFIPLFERSSKLGNPKGSFMLGYLLCVGYKDLPVDIERGSKILKKAFQPLSGLSEKEHDFQAAKFLSEYYRVPLAGRVKDDEKVKALLRLSDTYREESLSPAGEGLESDFVPASGSGETALSGADTTAYDQLVRAISELKDDGSYDDKERLDLIKGSAEKGNMRAALFLAQAYLEGHYVPRDIDTSKLYFTKAEKAGSVKASYMLGRLAVEGNFSRQDVIQGLNRIYQASKAGLAEAQFYLGKIYYEGQREFDPGSG
jgi:TPR repeat protein